MDGKHYSKEIADKGATDRNEAIPVPTSYTFSINVSNACNLCCDYCFNKRKDGSKLDYRAAEALLDRMFDLFPDGEKYFVDLSGKGEPLLNLDVVLKIADYCSRKSDTLGREVLPTVVTNGILLNGDLPKTLQEHGILFGVSIDGNREIHDRHRKRLDGKGTYDEAMANVLAIENRDYIGCAATFGNDVFSIRDSLIELSKVFKTVSYRPARGPFGINRSNLAPWCREFDQLAEYLLGEALSGNLAPLFTLLNGDDFFGRFICLAIDGKFAANRCDAAISRFSLDVDGKIYGCAPMSGIVHAQIEKPDPIKAYLAQLRACAGCPWRPLCGGECPVELARMGFVDSFHCLFKRHLIILANYIALRLSRDSPPSFEGLKDFVKAKKARHRIDPDLSKYLSEHPDLGFVEAKRRFDREWPRY